MVNQAAGFNRCTNELQDWMFQHVTFLQTHLRKGKSSTDVADTLRDLMDYLAFHQNVSIVIGTALQHLADSLFVHLANLVLIRRDS